jgi:hypothetical protein
MLAGWLACCKEILKIEEEVFNLPDFSASLLAVIFRDRHLATCIVGQWR